MSKRYKRFILILFLGLTALITMAQENFLNEGRKKNMSEDEKKIRNIIENQYPGFVRSGDINGYAGQFTSDALYMPPGISDLKGPDAIKENLSEELKTMRFRPVITAKEVSIFGDYAYAIGKGNLTIIPIDGSDELNVVYTLFWFLRKVDNQWKIARQIWNEKP